MATVDRESEEQAAGDVATRLATAPFVRIVARADGDGVAAAGVLGRALAAEGVPFQVTTGRTAADRAARARADVDGETLLAGAAPALGEAIELPEGAGTAPLSVRAWRVADDLLDDRGERSRTATLALAGAVAAGVTPGTAGTAPLLETVDPERRPGVVTPTTAVDGLAHSTLVHGPFSGSPERVRETLGPVASPDDAETAHRLASATALTALNADGATAAAADAVERALRPRVAGPLETVGGYADVLDAAARESPGAAVALALGHDAREPALTAWREHGRRAHEAVRTAATSRYDGLLAVRVDRAPAATVARLIAAYRSPEPVVAVVADGAAAAAVRPDVADAPELDRAVRTALDGEAAVDATSRPVVARLPETTEPTAFVAGLREALS